jgi:subtilisin family serine protease
LAERHRGSVDKVFTSSLRGFVVEMSKSDATALSSDPRVLFVEEDAEIWPSYTAQSSPDWGLDRIDQPTLPLNTNFVYERNGIGVNAYVIDSGINPSHVDFGGRASVAFDALSDGRNGIDCRGHGTHVAGIIGSSVHGVAKAVTLRAIRVLPCTGSGQVSDLLAGVDWLTTNRILPAVANISINASGISNAMTTSITNSINSGITYVVSAGNFNDNACNYSPANISAALVAGASTASDNRAGYSNFGPCIDVWAPGHSITSTDYLTNDGSRVMSGTSQASPMVAGVAALYLQNNPAASPATVHNAVRNSSTNNIVTNIDGTSTRRLLSSWLGAPPPVPGHIRIIKEVRLRNGGTASPTVFNFSASNLGPSSFSLVDNDSPPADLYENPSVYVFESQGAVTVTQSQTTGWHTTSIVCVEEAPIDMPNIPNSTVNVLNRTCLLYTSPSPRDRG